MGPHPFAFFCSGLILSLQMVYSQESCGGIGSDSTGMYPSTEKRFVLNAFHTAECSGRITAYQYCYYASSNESSSAQSSFSFAIFEQDTAANSVSFRRVSDIIPVSLKHIPSINGDFVCVTESLPAPVNVRQGYLFGACITGNTTQFSIVGIDTASSLLVASDSMYADEFPSSLMQSTLSNMSGLALHLYANVSGSLSTDGLTQGEIAAIAVPLVILALGAIVVVAIFWGCKKVLTQRSSSSEHLFTANSPGFDNVGYCDVAAVQPLLGARNGGSRVQKSVHSDSVSYEVVDTQRSSLLYTPPSTTEESESEALSPDADTTLDSGSYAQVRTSPIRGPSSRLRAETVDTIDELVQRPVYEYECSRSRGVSFECSFDNVNHYEPMVAGLEYIPPVSTLPLSISRLLEMNKQEDIYSNVDPYQRPASKERELLAQLKSSRILTLEEDDIEVESNIGTGQFGTVHKGVWNEKGKRTPVALKSLKHDSTREDKVKFLQEAAIMAQFRHPNIIILYGVMLESQPMMLVVELALKGDLRTHLISIRPKPEKTPQGDLTKLLLQFSQQVALGMQYLSAKGFVHRDLAARNVLVSKTNVCKVADFGLSRDLATEKYYVSEGKDKIPVKWTAPEAIQYKKYSTASDVWAYGCLLYEIWSVGYKPFEGIPNIQVLRRINTGRRLPPPPGCPKMIYQLMILCWHPETSERPSFRDIVLTQVGSEEIVLNIPEEDSSTNPLAGLLGAPLEAGENMYSELQRRYLGVDY